MSALVGPSFKVQIQAAEHATKHLRVHIVVVAIALSIRQPTFSKRLRHAGERRLGI